MKCLQMNLKLKVLMFFKYNKMTNQVDALFSGEMYVDFHTNEYPNGEI